MFHTFGCPFFVLDARLKSGLSTCPKWEPRSRLGIYVERSPAHTKIVALVLNPRTGRVLPQFHIVFDYLFTTVSFMNNIQIPPNWDELVKDYRELVTDEQFSLAKTWLFQSADSGDIVSIPEPRPILQQAENTATATSEPIVNSMSPTVTPPIDFLANNPERLTVCEGRLRAFK